MRYVIYANDTSDASASLTHYRTKGSKNGVRQWQNKDGSLTPEGRIHYGVGGPRKSGSTESGKSTSIKSMLAAAVRKRSEVDKNEAAKLKFKQKQEKVHDEREVSREKAIYKNELSEFRKNKKSDVSDEWRNAHKSVKSMSDDDLQRAIDRLNKERELKTQQKNITTEERALYEASKSFTRKLLEDTAKTAMTVVAKDISSSAGKKIGERLGETLAKRIGELPDNKKVETKSDSKNETKSEPKDEPKSESKKTKKLRNNNQVRPRIKSTH